MLVFFMCGWWWWLNDDDNDEENLFLRNEKTMKIGACKNLTGGHKKQN